ncbi:isoprenyl transferase [Hellea balneolensis]|uniref:isoprenyl transferase n=1 Tax=Hellea balneolensis TaxID=287478 RepID=UPI00047AF362|nr:isoprenyl transferase [Hellea balneolensis]
MAASNAYQASFPLHVAIIMDGNGRWAQARHRPRVFGHQEGVKTVRRIVEDAADLGVQHLTLYSFSTENWTRPKAEIAALFNLLKKYVEDDLDTLNRNNVRIRILGSREGLKPDLRELIRRVEMTTEGNTEFNLNIAFNYGGRDEILRAAAKAVADGKDLSSMKHTELTPYLDTADLPEPDLVIRTSGEKRISNFLLWQAAYAEFVFTDVLWPDFKKEDLLSAISDFQNRDRRFGNLNASEVA